MIQAVLVVGLLAGLSDHMGEDIAAVNARLSGQLIDFTHNHGSDRRIYSRILCQKRDLYVYLPPCFDPSQKYPLIIWFHGAFGDESPFVRSAAIDKLDQMIASGCFPPVIVAAPDATIRGENALTARSSMFINGESGCFENHLHQEMIPFILSTFPIRPEREARVLNGYSGGALPAMAQGIKRRDDFGVVVAISGPLNIRYSNVNNRYFANFDPCTYRWATKYRPCQKVTMYFGGLLHVPAKFFIMPIFGNGKEVIDKVKKDNPADLIFSRGLQPGELQIYIRYAGRDNFNFDAQNESFVWLARKQGIEITATEDPNERHTADYCTGAQIQAYHWLAPRLAPYAPAVTVPTEEVAAQETQNSPEAHRSSDELDWVADPSASSAPNAQGEASPPARF